MGDSVAQRRPWTMVEQQLDLQHRFGWDAFFKLRAEAAQQRWQANILLSHIVELYGRIVASQPEHIAEGRLKLRHK